MSDLFFPLALVATFGAVGVGAFAIELRMSDRRRAVQLLESQLRPIQAVYVEDGPANLRERDLSKGFGERLVGPVMDVLNKLVRRLTPKGAVDAIGRKLVIAGGPPGWSAELVATAKVAGAIGGAALGTAAASVLGETGLTPAVVGVLFAVGGYLYPDVLLSHKVEARQTAIRKALPDTMDLLTISVEAGLGFDAAIAQVVSNVPGPLAQEMARMLQEMSLGVPRADAFRHVGTRTEVEELNGFILAMVQADVFGVSISKVLRAQAKEMRMKRRQRAEQTAMQLPVKLIFPTLLCIMPALFVVVLGPGLIRISGSLLKSL
jgi:tight adherence protein C